MKKTAVAAITVLAFVIVFSGCDFNLFEAIDTVKVSIPDIATATSDQVKAFVDDVKDYIDSGAITEENAGEVVDALEVVYSDPPDVQTGQEAAILAGEISITADPETKAVVDNVVSTFTAMMDPDYTPPGDDSDTEALLRGLFPEDDTDFHTIYTNLKTASKAYKDFAATIDTNGDGVVDTDAAWIESSEKGDIATYAIVSIAVTTISETDLHSFLYGNGDLTEDPVNNSNELLALLDFAGISLN